MPMQSVLSLQDLEMEQTVVGSNPSEGTVTTWQKIGEDCFFAKC